MFTRRWFVPLMVLTLLASVLMVPRSSFADTLQPGPFERNPVRLTAQESRYAPGQVLVRMRDGSTFVKQGIEPTRMFQTHFRTIKISGAKQVAPRTYRLNVDEHADVPALARQLAGDPNVAYAQPNYYRYAHRSVNDPLSPFQYALDKIDAFNAWRITTGSPNIKIAIIDTGVAANHPDLTGRVLGGYDFVNNNADASDDEGHGTHTAGIAAAAGDNNEGIAGVCWRCTILPVKVLDDQGMGLDEWVANGIRWAADNGARVINLSLGGPEHTPILHEAIKYAVNKNILVVTTAGNVAHVGNPVQYPAAYDEVLTVGATDENDRRAFFSGVHSYVDVSAPGWNIPSTFDPNGLRYVAFSGTSEAAPHVAGLAGLLLSINPNLDVNALRAIITGTSDDLGAPGPDPEYGVGRINAGRAVASVRNPAYDPINDPQQPGVSFFPETRHTLRGEFKRFWELNGGLPVFGFPISEEFHETTSEGTFLVQYFERNRFEFHPEKPAPYNVLLGRLSDAQLLSQGRNWFTFPKGQPQPDCWFFEETGHSVCEPFLSYWRNNGLLDPQLSAFGRSLALFGLPLSESMMEVNSSGDNVLTQWFERARFEFHPDKPPQFQVLLGLLGNEAVKLGVTTMAPSGHIPLDRCADVPPPIDAAIRPRNCAVVGSWITIEASGFAPNESISFFLSEASGGAEPIDELTADDQGRVGVAGIVGLPPGVYALVLRGDQSRRQSVAYIKMIDR